LGYGGDSFISLVTQKITIPPNSYSIIDKPRIKPVL
jgi:hypothetical protein